jgi:hypothetical protein
MCRFQEKYFFKGFRVLIGVFGKKDWPHHGGKVGRSRAPLHQFYHYPDQYTPMWIEFHPYPDPARVHDRNDYEPDSHRKMANNAKADQARALITDLRSQHHVTLEDAPPARVAGPACRRTPQLNDRQWSGTAWTQDNQSRTATSTQQHGSWQWHDRHGSETDEVHAEEEAKWQRAPDNEWWNTPAYWEHYGWQEDVDQSDDNDSERSRLWIQSCREGNEFPWRRSRRRTDDADAE